MLVVFGGLPGTGKTTISRMVAARLAATWLRIDVIEQAIRAAGVLSGEVGPAGYMVANALAFANLVDGRVVVADGVNPVPESRDGWRATAKRAGRKLLEVEVICSDRAEHRRRVEGRQADIDGLVLPTWEAVVGRDYVPWVGPHVVIDTAVVAADAAVAIVERHVAGLARAEGGEAAGVGGAPSA